MNTEFFLPLEANKPQKSAHSKMLEQLKHLTDALLHVKSWRRAIDGGAHCGLWTCEMAKVFRYVLAFEPDPGTFDFLEKNSAPYTNISAVTRALGDEHCLVSIGNPTENRLSHYVTKDSAGAIPMMPIDSLNLSDLDFLKLDLEGAEPLALLGARETIARCRPVIIVEDKGWGPKRYGSPSVADILTLYNYRFVWKQKPDCLWMPQ